VSRYSSNRRGRTTWSLRPRRDRSRRSLQEAAPFGSVRRIRSAAGHASRITLRDEREPHGAACAGLRLLEVGRVLRRLAHDLLPAIDDRVAIDDGDVLPRGRRCCLKPRVLPDVQSQAVPEEPAGLLLKLDSARRIILTSIPAVVRECWHSREVGRKLAKVGRARMSGILRSLWGSCFSLVASVGIAYGCSTSGGSGPSGTSNAFLSCERDSACGELQCICGRLHEIVLGKFRLWRARSEDRLRHSLCRTNRTLYAVGCTRQRFLRADVPIEQRL